MESQKKLSMFELATKKKIIGSLNNSMSNEQLYGALRSPSWV